MTDKLRKITRIFGIPIIILFWVLWQFMQLGCFVLCLLDLNPDEIEYTSYDLFDSIKAYLLAGAMTL